MRAELAVALGWTLQDVKALTDPELATVLAVLEDRR